MKGMNSKSKTRRPTFCLLVTARLCRKCRINSETCNKKFRLTLIITRKNYWRLKDSTKKSSTGLSKSTKRSSKWLKTKSLSKWKKYWLHPHKKIKRLARKKVSGMKTVGKWENRGVMNDANQQKWILFNKVKFRRLTRKLTRKIHRC